MKNIDYFRALRVKSCAGMAPGLIEGERDRARRGRI
jgi:hypothetical protein